MDTINGLPAHPLLVHAVIVLVPLTALMAVISIAWPAANRKLGFLTPLVALVALIAVPLTTGAGEALEKRVPHSEAVERHAQLGDALILWMGPLFALCVLWWVLTDDRALGMVRARVTLSESVVRGATIVLGLATVIVAVLTIVTVYRIGDSGASAVWSDLPPARSGR